MKKNSILTILAALLTFSSCEEDPILGCTDPTAINYNELATANVAYTADDGVCIYSDSSSIIDVWTTDSSMVEILLTEDILEVIVYATMDMTAEEFEEELGFPMPNSDEQWLGLIDTWMQVDDAGDYGSIITITNNTFSIDNYNEIIELEYQLVNDNTIEFINPGIPNGLTQFEYFGILELTESNLTLTSILEQEDEQGDTNDYKITLYLSK